MRKTAIVTGGSRGIGRSICIALANAGYNVVINYAGSKEKAEETAAKCRNFGVETLILQGDVSCATDCEQLVSTSAKAFGSIDILVNNAGISRDNLLVLMKEDEFDEVIATNLKGCYNMMKAVVRPMMKQRAGRIVNISSVVGLMGNVGQANYAASKAGVIGMTKSLARELATRNITVNAVAPGFIETDMTAGIPVSIAEKMLATIPAGHFGNTDDVAQAVVFLCSEHAGYITGQILCVDGGMAMM